MQTKCDCGDNRAVKASKMESYGSYNLWFSSQLPLKYYWVLVLQMPGRWHGQTQLPQKENILKVAGHKSHRYPPLEKKEMGF